MACAVDSQIRQPRKPSPDDFRFGQVLETGTFSTVFHAENIHNKKEVAIKVYDKQQVIRENKSKYVKRERDCMTLLNGVDNGFVRILSSFQDQFHLYIVMSYAKNGEFLPYILKPGSLELNVAKFYAAELLLAIESMHALGIIHRDLKPENLLLNEDMHLMVADFNTAKILQPCFKGESNCTDEDYSTTDRGRPRKLSFVGTAEYVSPELLCRREDTKASDLWAFGCIIYHMVSGQVPFQDYSDNVMFQKILKVDYAFKDGFPDDARDLVEKLLVLDHNERLGAKDAGNIYSSIRRHKFFYGTDFDTIWLQTPPMSGLASYYTIPSYLQPGLKNAQLMQFWNVELTLSPRDIMNLSPYRRMMKLAEQARSNQWHKFVDEELIIKQGLVMKGKGVFARERMLLATTGPRLFYVDPSNMILKGEIRWTSELSVKAKTFKSFCVYTPERKYRLRDPKGYALEWVRIITEVHLTKFPLDSP